MARIRGMLAGLGPYLLVSAILTSAAPSQTPPAEPPPVALELAPPIARIGQSSAVTVLNVSPDGRRVGIGRANGEVEIWDTLSRQTAMRRNFDGRVVVALSPDLETVATLLRRQATLVPRQYGIEIWELKSGDLRHTLQRKDGLMVLATSFSPDGETLAVAVGQFYFGGVHLWDLRNGRLRRELEEIADDIGTTCGVTSVTFSPDGSVVYANDILSAKHHLNGVVGLWDTPTGKWRASLNGGKNSWSWFSLAVSADQAKLAVIDRGKARLWDLGTATLIRELELSTDVREGRAESRANPYSGYWTDRELSVEFSPDGKLLATSNGTVEVWDVATGSRKLMINLEIRGSQSCYCSVNFWAKSV